MLVKIKQPFKHDGENIEIGGQIDLDEKEAETLIKLDLVEEVKGKKQKSTTSKAAPKMPPKSKSKDDKKKADGETNKTPEEDSTEGENKTAPEEENKQ